MKLSTSLRRTCGVLSSFYLLAFLPSCDFSGHGNETGVGIQNVTQAAPHLEEFNDTGNYKAYWITADMGRPRYFHASAVAQSGFAVVLGGSDERGYSGIDTVEMYDQSTFDADTAKPESGSGIWLDTNFEGDPIAFENGSRLLFTVNLLADGRLICLGGTQDLLAGTVQSQGEFYDPETRTFETIDADMVEPRFRHASIQMNDGGILLLAGQIQTTVTVINEDIPEGYAGRQSQMTVFITTAESEIYQPTENAFSLLTLPGSTKASKLNTPRGRAGHAVARLAGPDRTLNSSDDIFVVAGGFQALSAQFAPRSKTPGAVARTTADGLTIIEFFDPQTQVFTQVGNVQLGAARINDPYIMNLGTYNDYTTDGVKGMGNVILITHGNTDDSCPVTPVIDELLAANYTGFGPAQGLQFFLVEDTQNYSHVQGIEYGTGYAIGRCATNPIALPRKLKTVQGVDDVESWIITTMGVYIFVALQCVYDSGSDTVIAGCVFDPFFNIPALQIGLSARDLSNSRTTNNPTGVVGTWFTIDGFIPTVDATNYGNTQASRWAKANAVPRIFHRNIQLAGEDGIMNTSDDRVLLAGGGKDYGSQGGEPCSPSSEILLTPNLNEKDPSP